ncbi:MAG: homoserine kinase [Myxococcota bacterium]
MESEVQVFAPATVANVAAGFDVLGFAMHRPGDTIVVRFSGTRGLRISEITGDDGTIPREPTQNTGGIAALAMLQHLGIDRGIDMQIHKGIPVGSGIGSSACSAVAAVVAVNELLDRPLTRLELLPFALEGEAAASGGAIHADNVGPCLLGGMILVRSNRDLDTVSLPSPTDLFAAVVLPDLQILTTEARAVLRPEIPMKDAITQWGNLAGLVAGLVREDYGLIARSLHDVVAEPYRKSLIPGFDEVRDRALEAGALGCSISGAGPAMFALCQGDENAFRVAIAMQLAFQKNGLPAERFVSSINPQGAQRIK